MIKEQPVAPQQLKRYGFEYVLMTKDEQKALYVQYFDGKQIGFEVLMLKDTAQISSHSYPKHEDFGNKAWSFRTEQAAKEFYQQLTPRHHGQTALPF